jgi:Uri superfamily endonuclease
MRIVKGVYVLVLSICKDVVVNVGALGRTEFEKGLYAYVGSAQNGLEKRIERHLRKAKRKFWHIDYLLGNESVAVLGAFAKEAGRLGECRIAAKMGKSGVAVKGFGSSDCECQSHLFRIKEHQFFGDLMLERFHGLFGEQVSW